MLNHLWRVEDTTNRKVSLTRDAYLKNIFRKYLFTISTYYSTRNLRVHRPNVLVTLLETLNIQTSDSVDDIYTNVLDIGSYVSNNVGIVNTVNSKSKPLNGTVIKDSLEYILYIDEPFDYTIADNCFTSMECLYTNIDSILLTHPTKIDAVGSINIYTLNVAKLAIGYYYWCKAQEFIGDNTDIARYVFEVTYVNLIGSLLDHALLNRFINLSLNKKVSKFINFNPFNVNDYSRDIANLYLLANEKIHTHRCYSDYLESIPAMHKDTMLDIVAIPETYYNKRNTWLVWLSRFDILTFLIHKLDRQYNKHRVDDIDVLLKYKLNGKYFTVYDKTTNLLLNSKIDKIKKEL